MLRMTRLTGAAILFALILGVLAVVQAQQAKPLGEADLIKLVELQVGDEAVVARVDKAGVGFPVDAATWCIRQEV